MVYRSSVSYNISKKLRLSVTGVNKAVASRGEMEKFIIKIRKGEIQL